MDHGYALARPLRPLPRSLAEGSARVSAFLAGGGRALVLSGPHGSGKSAVLDHLVAGISGRVLRIGNPGPGPLDIAAMLHQLGHAAVDEADEQGLFLRTVAELAYDDYSAVLAIEDAHTLTRFALSALARIPGLGGPDLPGMILVLSGEPAMLAKLAAPGLEHLRNSRRTLLLKLPALDVRPAPPGHAGEAAGEMSTVPSAPKPADAADCPAASRRAWRDLRLVAMAAAAGSLATGGVLAWRQTQPGPGPLASFEHQAVSLAADWPDTAERPAPGVPRMATTPAAPPAAPPVATKPEPAPQPATQTAAIQLAPPPGLASTGPARLPTIVAPLPPDGGAQTRTAEILRRDFDAFLDRSGHDTASLPIAKRDALFQGYLRWNNRPGARPPAAP